MGRRSFLRTRQKSVPERAGPSLDIDKVADGNYWLALDAKALRLVDIMSLRGVKLCNQCTVKHPGKWQGKPDKAQYADCESEC